MNEPLRQRQPRERVQGFITWLHTLPCSNPQCPGGHPIEAAHVRMTDLEAGKRYTGKAERPSDRWAVPLCSWCHREGPQAQHRGSEAAFWQRVGVDPIALAKKIWRDWEFFRFGP